VDNIEFQMRYFGYDDLNLRWSISFFILLLPSAFSCFFRFSLTRSHVTFFTDRDSHPQEGGSAVRSLDNVRRFWLSIRGRKKFVPSVHAGVLGSDRGSHRRGTGQAEGASAEKSGRRGMNAAVCALRTIA